MKHLSIKNNIFKQIFKVILCKLVHSPTHSLKTHFTARPDKVLVGYLYYIIIIFTTNIIFINMSGNQRMYERVDTQLRAVPARFSTIQTLQVPISQRRQKWYLWVKC